MELPRFSNELAIAIRRGSQERLIRGQARVVMTVL